MESVFDSLLDLERALPRSFISNIVNSNIEEKVIITTCVTGIGTALKIKKIISDKLRKIECKNIEIIPLGLIEEYGSLSDKINNIRLRKKVIAIVGTVNPEIPDINFLPRWHNKHILLYLKVPQLFQAWI
ncbi:hypothetical protein ACSVC9_03555 [Clostridium sp. LBM24168]